MSIDCCMPFRDGDIERARCLLESGENVHQFGDHAIVIASIAGNLEMMQLLIDYGIKIDAAEGAAVCNAGRAGQLEAIKLLFKHGAKLCTGKSSFYYNYEIIKFFLLHGANPDYFCRMDMDQVVNGQFIMAASDDILRRIDERHTYLYVTHRVNYVKRQIDIIYKYLLSCYYRPNEPGYHKANEHFKELQKN